MSAVIRDGGASRANLSILSATCGIRLELFVCDAASKWTILPRVEARDWLRNPAAEVLRVKRLPNANPALRYRTDSLEPQSLLPYRPLVLEGVQSSTERRGRCGVKHCLSRGELAREVHIRRPLLVHLLQIPRLQLPSSFSFLLYSPWPQGRFRQQGAVRNEAACPSHGVDEQEHRKRDAQPISLPFARS